MQLRLIRHGESVANRDKRIQGQLDYPLSAEGKQQARLIAKWLKSDKIDAIYSSDLSRAYDTAQEIAAYHQGIVVQQRTDLREILLGRFQGLTDVEIEERYPQYSGGNWMSTGLEDVEQVDQLRERAFALLDALSRKHQGESIVCVSHGGFIGSLIMNILQIDWREKRIFAFGNTSMTTLYYPSFEEFMILGVNETPHLFQSSKEESQEKSKLNSKNDRL